MLIDCAKCPVVLYNFFVCIGLVRTDAGLFALARTMIDWVGRRKVGGASHRLRQMKSPLTHFQCASFVQRVDHEHIPSGLVGSWVAPRYCHGPRTRGNRLVRPRACFGNLESPPVYLNEFRVGLNNYMHPRTDAVVITAVLDETGDRILLGRNASRICVLSASGCQF